MVVFSYAQFFAIEHGPRKMLAFINQFQRKKRFPFPKQPQKNLIPFPDWQFGDAIRDVVGQVLAECGVEKAKISVVDRGALDCVIRARVEAAVQRGKGEN